MHRCKNICRPQASNPSVIRVAHPAPPARWLVTLATVAALLGPIGCDSAQQPTPAAGEPRPAGSEAPAAPPGSPTGVEKAHEAVRPDPADPEPPAELVRARVKLVVLGSFPEDLADAVEDGLREAIDVDVERIDGVPLPRFAYYEPRRRYRAERLLSFLNQRLAGEPASTRVLGLTSVDISTTKGPHRDWGIFGLGEIGGRSCVISSFRLRRRARDRDHLTFRVATTAVHEVGHTLGLEHCAEPRCLMRDAEGSIETVDSSTGELGPECVRRLDRRSPRAIAPIPAAPSDAAQDRRGGQQGD